MSESAKRQLKRKSKKSDIKDISFFILHNKMDSFPTDFSPETFDPKTAQEKLYRAAFDQRLDAFRKRKNLWECKFTFSPEEVENPQSVNEYIEKLRSNVTERDPNAVLVVEYHEAMPQLTAFIDGPEATPVDPNNFRIHVGVKKREEYEFEVDDCCRTLRALLVRQVKNRENTEHKARVPYNLYESSMEIVKSELESRGWDITIMRRYRGVNCNRGMVVFEMAPPRLGGGEEPERSGGSVTEPVSEEEKMRNTRLDRFDANPEEPLEDEKSGYEILCEKEEESRKISEQTKLANMPPPPPAVNVTYLGTTTTTTMPEYTPINVTKFNDTAVPAPWEKTNS